MGSQQQEPAPRRKGWGGCWGGLSCFGTQKGGKRIVPASRIPESNSLANASNAPHNVGLTHQTTTLAPSLLAPPSSPASFSNSALPSTAQSPSCFMSMSANSPEGPSSTMFATGPYAHETQLVSPPVFSTFTTEPSTAPLTPPPELAHLTTPSSPDVPFAQFLSSSRDLKGTEKTNYITANDLQATYSLYPGSPASTLRSPVSRTSGDCLSSSFPEREFPLQWVPSASSQGTKYPNSESPRLTGLHTATASTLSQDSNFFCPATFAQFYLDSTPLPHSGGRLSVSKDSDVYSNGGSGHQNRQNKTCKQDEEIEAYRASFGFSADEIITTAQYVEISDVLDDSFTMTPTANKSYMEGSLLPPSSIEGQKAKETHTNLLSEKNQSSEIGDVRRVVGSEVPAGSGNDFEGHISWRQPGDVSGRNVSGGDVLSDEDDVFSNMGTSKISRKYHIGLSSSDAEIDYRRGRSLRQGKGDFAWRD